MKRRTALCTATALTILSAAGLAAVPVAASAAPAGSASPAASSPPAPKRVAVTVGRPRLVNFAAIAGRASPRHPRLALPFHRLRVRSAGGASPRRTGIALIPAPRQAAATGATWTAFPVMSRNRQAGFFGQDQDLQPPDTQVAAGPGAVVEADNDTISVWSKTGLLLAAADLNAFFPVPSSQLFSDPRVMFDTGSGRWLVSGLSFDSSSNSATYLAVSASSDPTGNFFVYTLVQSGGVLTDQPVTGVCDDKVVMSWNNISSAGNFMDAETLVAQKSSLLAGAAVRIATFSSAGEFRIVPAQSLSPTTTCWLTVNKADSALPGGSSTSPRLGVIAVTGTPDAANVAETETGLPVTATTLPPLPHQPSGVANDSVNADELVSAAYRDGVLWTSGSDGCAPSGTAQDCMRLFQASVSSTPSLLADLELATSGIDEYYPAVSLDNTDNLFVSYSASSPNMFPGAFAAIRRASDGSLAAPLTVAAGSASYNGGSRPRWGDYSAAAPDPTQPNAMWVGAEYAPSDAGSGDWATAAAEISLTAPPAAAIAVGAEGGDGALWAQAPQLGTGWHSLGGKIIAPPAVAAPPNRNGSTPVQPLFVATGANHNLYVRSLSAGWQLLGPMTGTCLNGPAAVITGTSTLTVTCEGTDRALWVNSTTVPASGLPQLRSAWTRLGGTLAAGPAVAPVRGAITYFVLGTNGQIFTRTNTAGYAGTPWRCIGSPAAAAEPASNDTVFACQGTNHALFVSANGGVGWTPAFSLGGSLIGGPAVAATSRVTGFAGEGGNHGAWQRTLFSGWVSLGGTIVGGIGAVGLD